MLKRLISIFIFFIFSASLWSTHNRAGEISFEQIGNLTIRVTITTYTKTSSTAADRDSLEVFWGDDTSEFVLRDNGNGDEIDNDVKINYYIAEHTYPGRDTYTIFFMDPNRVDNILNVNPPNSVDVPFYLETTFTFLNSQFQGINNSPKLLQAPLDFACVGQTFMHNPNAYDADGDSLAYELIIPLQMEGMPVPDYSYPDQIAPGPDNIVTLDPLTGDFVWNAPKIQGEYNIAIRIKEYRSGILISSMIRDMQIFVQACDNRPPIIETIDEICVVAGELLEIDIRIDDPDEGQQVFLSATGGPFEKEISPATMVGDSVYMDVAYQAKFIWQTTCEHINDHYYQVVLRAVDNYFEDTGLATLKTLRIKVVGPPPENLEATTEDDAVRLTWDFPYTCQNAMDDYFKGFTVWRKLLSTPFPIDTCETGLDGKGYEKISFNTFEDDGNQFFFVDTNVERGNTYCYRILGDFAQTTSTGNTFNRVESLASNEVCLQLSRDLPIITEVTVLNTDNATGETRVHWIKPLLSDFDTLLNPGPYAYILSGGTDLGNLAPLPQANYSFTFFNDLVDTNYIHRNINTENDQFFYRVDLLTGADAALYGSSQEASSVFAQTSPNDKRLEISWNYSTPWQNYEFVIYKFNETTMVFDSLDITSESSYTERDLENGKEYCYYVKTIGTYGIDDIESPLYNNSQEICGIPIDLEPPCPPVLEVESLCDKIQNLINLEDLINDLFWTNPNDECDETDDVQYYNIYFAVGNSNAFSLLSSTQGENETSFEHLIENDALGCYAITAVDEKENESEYSNIICVENCPLYELPNTFTPNGDTANDFFKPTKNIFVDRVEFKVFNRWGNLVFETEDPLINWDGKNLSGKDLNDGTYYYSCRVFEQSSGGIVEGINILSGHINLIRG